MICVIDNYDSFTYNLVQYLGELGEELWVVRNDQINVEEIKRQSPKAILISPGPGSPDDAGIAMEVICNFSGQIPILGICLGHQAIAQVYGGKVVRASHIMHGNVSQIYHDGEKLFDQLPNPFHATRYHSLIVDEESLPEPLVVTARSIDGEIMGIRHRELPVEGVQFHPESILSEHGKQILLNFLKMYLRENEV